MSSTPSVEIYDCENCKYRDPFAAGNSTSSNFRCTRCRFMDSLPIIIKSSSNKEEEACSICLMDFNSEETMTTVINELPCRHHFHKKCISEWIVRSQKSSCPLCRYQLPIEEDTITRPMEDGVRPARYQVQNGQRFYQIPSSDSRMALLLDSSDGSGYYVPWPLRTTSPQVVTRPPRTTTPQVVTTNSTTSGTRRSTTTTTTTTTSDRNNNTTILQQDDDGDTLMLDNTILLQQDEDGDTMILDA